MSITCQICSEFIGFIRLLSKTKLLPITAFRRPYKVCRCNLIRGIGWIPRLTILILFALSTSRSNGIIKGQIITHAPVNPANLRILIVAKDGSGQYSSIQAAANASQPGDTIQVKNGTYSEGRLLLTKSGTSSLPITLMAYPGNHPIYNAGVGTAYGIEIDGSWWILDGFEITGNYDGLHIYGSNNTIRNCNIHANQNQGMLVTSASDVFIADNTISFNGAGSGAGLTNPCNFSGTSSPKYCHAIYIGDFYCVGQQHITIIRNVLSNQSGAGIQVYNVCDQNVTGLHPANNAPTHDNLIENNIFAHNSTEMLLWKNANNNTIINNTVIHDTYPTTDDNYHVIFSFYKSSGNIVKNNIIYSTMSGSNAYPLDSGLITDTQTFDYNLWRVPPNTGWHWQDTYKTDFNSQYKSTTGYDNNGPPVPSEPQFVNLSGEDYRITSTSPARNHGTNVNCPFVDKFGTPRPQESICDIGMHEYRQ